MQSQFPPGRRREEVLPRRFPWAVLEAVSAKTGIDLGRVEAPFDGPKFRDRSRRAADDGIRALLPILEESGPPEGPLRAKAPTVQIGFLFLEAVCAI